MSAGVTHPGLDDLLIHPARLVVLATLSTVAQAEFKFVRDAAGLSDSVLSKQAATLAEGGYLRIEKGYVGKRPRTWLAITTTGRRKLTAHLTALQAIAAMAAQSTQSDPIPNDGPTPG